MSDLLNISVAGAPRIEGIIDALDGGLDTVKILDESAAVLYNRMKDNFLRERDPLGNAWIPSAAAQHRAAIGRGGGTLYDTGNLWRSIQIYAESETSRAIGTDVPYAPFHQYGTIHLPARQFLGFGPDDAETVQEIAIRRIAEVLAA